MSESQVYKWLKDLFPLNRSLSGDGNRETLRYMKNINEDLMIHEIPAGAQAFDWTIPDEWNVRSAYIESMEGNRIIDFCDNNLHLVGYSEPIDRVIDKSELVKHIHYLSDRPNDIPYVTSYYSRTWGFCMSAKQFQELGEGPFRVYIDSDFKSTKEKGALTYGEIFLPGKTSHEVLFSTYICHPSMASNELSGPVTALALSNYIKNSSLHYSYRFLFLPETIGSIYYISRNLERLKEVLVAGWVLTCLGDSGEFSYVPSRQGDNYADKVTMSVLKDLHPNFKVYSWLDRGSDERQFCSPSVDLPVCSITRSKYGTYPEYHTSADDLTLVTDHSLMESIDVFKAVVLKIESQRVPKARFLCEPQLGRRGLYPNVSTRSSYISEVENISNVLSYLDGRHTLLEVAEKCRLSLGEVHTIVKILDEVNLITQ